MLGALAGDIIGSSYESDSQTTNDFDFFSPNSQATDDSVMTVAVAHALTGGQDYASAMRLVGIEYPTAGYGGHFIRWLHDPTAGPYHSWGNGGAMRASPIGWAFDTEAEVIAQARAQAEVSHNHPEGIRGSVATALAVFWARKGATKSEIAQRVTDHTGYDLTRTLHEIRPGYDFAVRAEHSVPEALIAFLESTDFDDALRNAISLGGDADTQACIAGAVAEVFYGGVPEATAEFALDRLNPWLLELSLPFFERFGLPSSAQAAMTAWKSKLGTVSSTSTMVISRVHEFGDAAEVGFSGPTIFGKGPQNMASLTELVKAGWIRLLLDVSAVKTFSKADWVRLEFLRKSCRIRRGLVAIFGTTSREPFSMYESRSDALRGLDASRGKGRMGFSSEYSD